MSTYRSPFYEADPISTFQSIHDVKRASQRSGSHWFDEDAIRFFASRFSDEVFHGTIHVFFVSSERCRWDSGSRRMYSVRSFTPATGDTDTVGEFQAYRSRSTAIKAAQAVALAERNAA